VDPIANPFNPGAGSPPPELAGREDLLEAARISLERLLRNKPSKSMLLIGLRGAGKTVLLDRIRMLAEQRSVITIRVEAPENRSLPALLAPQLRLALLNLSHQAKAKEAAVRALRALAGFARALKLNAKYGDIEVGIDYEPEVGLADNGDFEQDLIALLEIVGLAAQKAETAIVLFIDELQYVNEEQLGALTVALHRCAQSSLPVALFGAGLPQLPGQMGKAKSYAERLFDFPFIGPLTPAAAGDAIRKPIAMESCRITDEAVDAIVAVTKGYPYFVQQWGKYTWDSAIESPFTANDVARATPLAVASLDESFFRVRFDRLTTTERRYLRAMAQLGPGPHRSGDIADELNRPVSAMAPVRANLLGKGMVWSPSHGDTAFTVPLFDEFLHRVMPGHDWRSDT
jgi:hypothetical protein